MEVITDEHIPTPSDEQGDSIAKVLEWFSRSSDSSDWLDVESNVQEMEDDTKIDDIDFEDDIDQRAKPRDNVFLIIPHQNEEVPSEVNTIFLQQTDWVKEQSVDEPTQNSKKEQRIYESASYKEPLIKKPSIDSALTANNVSPDIPEVNISVGGKVSLNENKIKRKEKIKINLENTDIKRTQNQPKEITAAEENQRPKIANLKSFWEKENIGPKILIGKSTTPAKNEHFIPGDISRKPTEGVEEQQRSEQSLKVTYPGHQKQERVGEDLDLEHVGNGNTAFKPQVPIFTNESKPPLIYANQKTDQIHASSPLEKDVPHLKSSLPSFDSGSLPAGQNGDSRGTFSINSSDADHTPPKELEAKSRTAPRTNQVPFVKQNSQQENMAERIKRLKSFWEKESRTSAAAAAQNRSTTTARLNQRFTKSEFDLRTIGTEYDDDVEDSTSARGRLSPNFSVHPLRKDKPVVMDCMSILQFKNLRDFWGGSPTKSGQSSPVHESGNQRSLSPQSQNERASIKDFVNESQNNKTSSPAKTRVFQSPSKKSIMSRQESGSKTDQLHMITGESISHGVSHSLQQQKGSQTSSEATMIPKPQVVQESQPKQGRRNSKGSLNGKANAMRRATSMFSVNTAVEEQSQDLYLQSKGPNLQQVKKAPDTSITQSRKTQEASYTLPKTSPEISWSDRDKNTQRRPSRTSEDSDSQPLARSFIPRDYHHYLGITEDRSMYTPPPVTEQVDDFICTSFTSSPETHRSCKCSPVKTSTPVQGSPDLQTRRGSLGRHSTTQTDGNATKGNLNREFEAFSLTIL